MLLCGELTLLQLAALMERASLYIGNDTGPMYIARNDGNASGSHFQRAGFSQPVVSPRHRPHSPSKRTSRAAPASRMCATRTCFASTSFSWMRSWLPSMRNLPRRVSPWADFRKRAKNNSRSFPSRVSLGTGAPGDRRSPPSLPCPSRHTFGKPAAGWSELRSSGNGQGPVCAGVGHHVATTDDHGSGRICTSPSGSPLQKDGSLTGTFRDSRVSTVSASPSTWLKEHVKNYDLVHIHAPLLLSVDSFLLLGGTPPDPLSSYCWEP